MVDVTFVISMTCMYMPGTHILVQECVCRVPMSTLQVWPVQALHRQQRPQGVYPKMAILDRD